MRRLTWDPDLGSYTSVDSSHPSWFDEVDLSRSEVVEQITHIGRMSSGWQVVWKLEPVAPTDEAVSTVIFELPSDQVFNMLVLMLHDLEVDKLPIPISFSPDLRTMSILHSVATMDYSPDGYRLQQLDEFVIKQANQYIRDNADQVQGNNLLIDAARWRQTLFSPKGSFLAIIASGYADEYVEEVDDGEPEYDDSTVIVYAYHADGWSEFGRQGPLPQLGGTKTPMLFHPLETGLVLSVNEQTCFWSFTESSHDTQDSRQTSNLTNLYPRLLHDSNFTDSGKYLFGVCEEYGTVRVTMPTNPGSDIKQADMDVVSDDVHRDVTNNEHQVLAEDPISTLSHALGSLDISHSWAGRSVESTALYQHKDCGIILSNHTMDGREREAFLLQIPRSLSSLGISPTLLSASDNPSTIKLVVNKAAQAKYLVTQDCSIALPIIVEREKKSIDTFTSNRLLEYSASKDQPSTRRKEHDKPP